MGLSAKENRFMVKTTIHDLPYEILCAIFGECVRNDGIYLSCNRGNWKIESSSRSPTLSQLSLVCRQWREILWNEQSLWSTVQIIVTGSRCSRSSPSPSRPNLLTTWLNRSGTHALDINVKAVSLGPHILDSTKSVLRTLIHHSSRWRSISLEVPPNALAPFGNIRGYDVPLLETVNVRLQLRLDALPYHIRDLDSLAFMQQTVKLRSFFVATKGVAFDTSQESWGSCGSGLGLHAILPCEQLMHLSLESGTHDKGLPVCAETILQLLSRCKNLRSCHLTSLIRDNRPGIPLPSSLNSLRELIIRDISSARVVDVLDALRVPNLDFLSINCAQLPLSTVRNFVGRSPIRTLILQEMDFQDETELLGLLRTASSSLVTLSLKPSRNSLVSCSFVESLAQVESEELCLRLENVCFGFLMSPRALDAAERFAMSRREGFKHCDLQGHSGTEYGDAPVVRISKERRLYYNALGIRSIVS